MIEIQLIQPEKSPGYTNNSRTGCYVPLGLISIATYIKQQIPDASIEILDGELISNKEIIDQLKPNSFVGIDTKTPNYVSALEIAKAAKEKNCKVIMGGVYASALPEQIIQYRRNIIDHIVVGYGEKPFIDIINGKANRIIYNKTPSFNELPIPDRGFVDFEKYIQNFRENHESWNWRGTNIFTHMGCKYKCLFCSRSGPEKTYYRDPNIVWEEIRMLVDEYNVEYIVDFSDTITQNMDDFTAFVSAKPLDLNPIFHVFSTADRINEKTIKLFKKLNAQHVFIGVETGDEALSKTIYKGKNFSPETSLKAITLLKKAKISVTPSFVLGLPGESEESLENTYLLAKSIKKLTDFKEIFCSALIPFPGSIAFDRLIVNRNTDIFDPENLKKRWIETFCNTDYQTIMSYVDKILSLGEYTITIKKLKLDFGKDCIRR